jgi:hypothetical protein
MRLFEVSFSDGLSSFRQQKRGKKKLRDFILENLEDNNISIIKHFYDQDDDLCIRFPGLTLCFLFDYYYSEGRVNMSFVKLVMKSPFRYKECASASFQMTAENCPAATSIVKHRLKKLIEAMPKAVIDHTLDSSQPIRIKITRGGV